jgi:hypothetical protein
MHYTTMNSRISCSSVLTRREMLHLHACSISERGQPHTAFVTVRSQLLRLELYFNKLLAWGCKPVMQETGCIDMAFGCNHNRIYYLPFQPAG